jgi:hypothetical protein
MDDHKPTFIETTSNTRVAEPKAVHRDDIHSA